jgi:MoxR-like ATPase
MQNLSTLGPLKVAEWRPGRRVPVASLLTVGDIEIPALEEPHLLLVPANVVYLQQMWDSLRMPSRNNLLITGESGSGKTTLIRYLGEIYRQALLKSAAEGRESPLTSHTVARAASFQTRILTFHENLRRSDITERRHYGESGEEKTGWTMSDVMDGMVAGDWNVLSEINRTGEDVQAEFNEPLENKSKSLHQRIIRGHPDSRFIATVNPGKSEGRGIYEGRVMSGEFVNRFTNKVHLCYLPPDQEFELLKNYGPDVDEKIIDRFIALAADIRRDYMEEHGVVPFPVTTRALIRMVRHLQRFPDDSLELRSLFWRKAYWLDDRIHPPVARKLVADLLDLHDIVDRDDLPGERSRVIQAEGENSSYLSIGAVSYPIGPGGPYVPDTVIEEVPQNLADLEWILKDIVLQENILLIGEAGVGKNKLESYLAHLLGYNLLVVGMSGETRVSDLLTYRSFGEDEVGKTGDTATLGLHALTDPEHGWIIVLDEANKAHPGVLVSFNDLLQDRLVRLPGGTEAPIRASICVNINPNRPPYEVNDFSFEFMDRFSIHTIVHLPADQAIEVLKKKYPEADVDFIRDVVQGYYALHPLYSSGILFEPVTMRNEEAAIERGLQYPDQACNLIDLLCRCYCPRDGRELNGIQGALQAAGFDRNVLPAAWALESFRTSWEDDKGDEGKAVTLSETYRAIGKPSAAQDVLRDMLSRNPVRDWVYHLKMASILLDSNQGEEAAGEIRKGFAEGRVVRMDNREEYVVLCIDVRIAEGTARVLIEAQNTRTRDAALIISRIDNPVKIIRRVSGCFLLSFTDTERGLTIFECRHGSPAEECNSEIPETGRGCEEPSKDLGVPLSSLVKESVMLGWSGSGFRQQICRLPSQAWATTVSKNGDLVREFENERGRIRLVACPDAGWSVEFKNPVSLPGKAFFGEIRWTPGKIPEKGELVFTLPGGGISVVPSPEDPNPHLAFSESSDTLYLVLKDDLAGAVLREGPWRDAGDKELRVRIISPGDYHMEVINPLFSDIYPRLQGIFRYSRPLSGYPAMGAGDILYTIQPDSQITTSVLVEANGMNPTFRDIFPGEETGVSGHGVQGNVTDHHTVLQRMVIPFTHLDACEDWLCRAFSPDTQGFLRDVRRYIASSLLNTKQPRDLAYEAKVRAILSDYRQTAEPAGIETTFSRGDILVRTSLGRETTDLSKSVLIVRFLQEGSSKGLEGSLPVIRGFWLGEQNPVATENFERIPGQYGLIFVEGDDKYDRIIRHLSGACQKSAYPWEFSRAGTRSDPVMRLEFSGFSIEYHPTDRRFRLSLAGEQGVLLSIEETGYPIETILISAGTGEVTRWQGTPLVDIRYLSDPGRVLIIIEDDLYSTLMRNRTIGDEPITGSGGVPFIFIPRSEPGPQ